MVERGLAGSRAKAQALVLAGQVFSGERRLDKPGQTVAADVPIEVREGVPYVSRGGHKLAHALDHFGVDPAGMVALDIGASTGGFSQVLLERGAAHVTAIDVGHGQMHPTLTCDPRVTFIEGLNARDLTADDLGGRLPDFLVSDVSFISLTLALPPALDLARPGASGLFLVKPQFEAGREAIGKGGLLRHPEDGPLVAARLSAWLGSLPGWRVLGLTASPIEGGDGNREFLLAGIKDQ
jgi:23S rRNA (cytidine1920-2'-O)/16S rRNA (cytidine1409-2'-O)-methyltransferase